MKKWTLTEKRLERLLKAVHEGDAEWIQKAVDSGLDPNVCIPFDRAQPDPPLLCAVLHSSARPGLVAHVVSALLAAGADPNRPEHLPPLFWASNKIHARMLLRAGADPAAKDESGRTVDKLRPFRTAEVGDVEVMVEFARSRARGELATPLAHWGFVEFAARRAAIAMTDDPVSFGLTGEDVSPEELASCLGECFHQLDFVAYSREHVDDAERFAWCALLGHVDEPMDRESHLVWLSEKPFEFELAAYKAQAVKTELEDKTPRAKKGVKDRWERPGGPM